jgi:hypothetical protein
MFRHLEVREFDGGGIESIGAQRKNSHPRDIESDFLEL